ncbi:MAG: hypothetical protein KKH28_14910 [Elusimicrobia bacterium]|nr:hypothetical protein [Elusimicrobiota bacterium]
MSSYKLRLKHPSGAEFEAEGPTEFILNEKTSFLAGIAATQAGEKAAGAPAAGAPPEAAFWAKIVEHKGELLKLRIKAPGIGAVEAVLILMAANRALNLKEDLSAIILSKALKTSGYEPDRLDRLLTKEIRESRITASGTKRNRTYRLTQKGAEAASAAIIRLPRDM